MLGGKIAGWYFSLNWVDIEVLEEGNANYVHCHYAAQGRATSRRERHFHFSLIDISSNTTRTFRVWEQEWQDGTFY